MQFLLTDPEYKKLREINPNFERVIILIDKLATNPYSDPVRVDLLNKFSQDLIKAEPGSIQTILGEWETILLA